MAAMGTHSISAQFRSEKGRAFTLIELLVVICIMMVLSAMLIGGVRHVHRMAAIKETMAELQVCQGLFREYENLNGLAGIEAYAGSPASQSTDTNSSLGSGRFPVFVDPSPVFNAATAAAYPFQGADPHPVPGTSWPVCQTGDVVAASTATDPTSYRRYQCNAVRSTHDVMYLLMRVPANRATVQSIQPKRILEAAPGQPPASIDQGPILLDGWGNPIIFIPRGGLYVNVRDPADPSTVALFLVRSTGVFRASAINLPLTGNERPFWASAGEDGDFTTGEDNLYSFQE